MASPVSGLPVYTKRPGKKQAGDILIAGGLQAKVFVGLSVAIKIDGKIQQSFVSKD